MPAMDAETWDRRYAGSPLVWSAGPNAAVARECEDLRPGTALDLGSGEGRNALWLAERGWRVTAVDFSAVATQRAADLAAERLGATADRLTAVAADLGEWQPEAPVDLVVLAYLQVPAPLRRRVHRTAALALAPGGTFLLVAHHLDNLEHGVGGPQDPEVLFTPDDVVADLGGTGVVIDRAERVERAVAPEGVGHGSAAPDQPARPALDVLVRAHRPQDRAPA
jgi:SAM-dependent methyltransferase